MVHTMDPLGSMSRSHQDKTAWARPLDWATNWEEWAWKALLTGLLKSTLKGKDDSQRGMWITADAYEQVSHFLREHGADGTQRGEAGRRHLAQLDVTHRVSSGTPAHCGRRDQPGPLHLNWLQLSPAPQKLRLHQPGVDGGPVWDGLAALLQGSKRKVKLLETSNRSAVRKLLTNAGKVWQHTPASGFGGRARSWAELLHRSARYRTALWSGRWPSPACLHLENRVLVMKTDALLCK